MEGTCNETGRTQLLLVAARAMLLALLLLAAALAILKLAGELVYPSWVDYGEGISLDRVRAALQGEPIYTPVGEPPYISWNFPPLYIWVCAALARWFGASFALGRAVSAIALLAAVLMVYALAREAGATRRWALLGVFSFLGGLPVVAWGLPMRCDHLALAFSLGGLWVVAAGRAFSAAGVLFALATLSRQSSAAGLLAALLWLGARREWRSVRSIALTWAGVVGAVLLWQSIASHGRIWAHLTLVNMNAYRVAWLWEIARPALASEGPLLAAVAFSLPAKRSQNASLFLGYLGFAFASVLLAGKIGSDWNYCLDLAAASSLSGAVAATVLTAGAQCEARTPARELLVTAAFLCHAVSAAGLPDVAGALQQLPGRRHVARTLAQTPGPIIADMPGVVVEAGHRLWLQPFEYTQLALAKRWDQTPLVKALERGEFMAIVLHFDPWDERVRDPGGTWSGGRFTDEMVRAIRSAYRVEEQWGRMRLLRPVRRATGR